MCLLLSAIIAFVILVGEKNEMSVKNTGMTYTAHFYCRSKLLKYTNNKQQSRVRYVTLLLLLLTQFQSLLHFWALKHWLWPLRATWYDLIGVYTLYNFAKSHTHKDHFLLTWVDRLYINLKSSPTNQKWMWSGSCINASCSSHCFLGSN